MLFNWWCWWWCWCRLWWWWCLLPSFFWLNSTAIEAVAAVDFPFSIQNQSFANDDDERVCSQFHSNLSSILSPSMFDVAKQVIIDLVFFTRTLTFVHFLICCVCLLDYMLMIDLISFPLDTCCAHITQMVMQVNHTLFWC